MAAEPTMSREASVKIDMNAVLRSLEEEPPFLRRATPLIPKAPHILRDRETYFVPSTITFGPIHHDDSKYEASEKVKRSLAVWFLSASGGGTTKGDLYQKVKDQLEDLKSSYARSAMEKWETRGDEDLALMFLVDGCAMLLFIYFDSRDWLEDIGFKNDLLVFTKHDLFLLENQLPYQLLDLLINSCSQERADELRQSITKFIDSNAISSADASWWEENEKKQEKQQQQQQQEKKVGPPHLLGILRERLIRVRSKTKRGNGQGPHTHFVDTFRSIHELKQNGIMFGVSDTNSLQDISLRRDIYKFGIATLRLPSMTVNDSTGQKLMNLMAYEMCPDFENKFEVNSYLSFLGSLIFMEEDVKELRDAGVLHNGLGTDREVVELFRKVGKYLVPHPGAYIDVKRRIHEHCNSVCAKRIGQIYNRYFTSAWSFLALATAVLGLGLTAAQTYYARYPPAKK